MGGRIYTVSEFKQLQTACEFVYGMSVLDDFSRHFNSVTP